MKEIETRKINHIDIVLNKEVEPHKSSFDNYRLPYRALPEIDLKNVDTSSKFFAKDISFPFYISSMTGGTEKATIINRNLAVACEEAKVGLGLGSMRIALENPSSIASFQVRKYCQSIPLFANLGMVQLNHGHGADDINKLIDLIDADGIFLHINPLQEAIQPEGHTNFEGLILKLEQILPKIKKPVIIKEVGTGIDLETIKKLKNIGVEWFDVSGRDGTNWSLVEGYRRQDNLGEVFQNEGIATVDALLDAQKVPGARLIAGGGIRNGLQIAKALILGAEMTTMAKPLLKPALESETAVISLLEKLKQELRISMFISGVSNLEELKKLKLSIIK